MKTISNLIYYSLMALYIVFFTCNIIIIFNALLTLDTRSFSFIVGLASMLVSYMSVGLIVFIFMLGLMRINYFITKKQIEDYLTDKFNQRKLPF
jgi:hypothetical protein